MLVGFTNQLITGGSTLYNGLVFSPQSFHRVAKLRQERAKMVGRIAEKIVAKACKWCVPSGNGGSLMPYPLVI